MEKWQRQPLGRRGGPTPGRYRIPPEQFVHDVLEAVKRHARLGSTRGLVARDLHIDPSTLDRYRARYHVFPEWPPKVDDVGQARQPELPPPFGAELYMAIRDGTWEIVRFNDAVCELTGYSRAELMHADYEELLRPGEPSHIQADLEQVGDLARLRDSETDSVWGETFWITRKGERVALRCQVRWNMQVGGFAIHAWQLLEPLMQLAAGLLISRCMLHHELGFAQRVLERLPVLS